jgi:hypothetical protein
MFQGYQPEPEPKMPDIGWLAIAVAVAFLVSFLVLEKIHEDHVYHGDRWASPKQIECMTDEFDRAAQTGEYDADACKPDMPWYAAHPLWYALAIGGAVLIGGRLYMFMRRTESGGRT